jgi:SAM-dependent methyltransferase
MKSTDRWERFWSDKNRPHHRQDSPEHFRQLAGEIRLILEGPLEDLQVLDLGCGSGSLFGPLGFLPENYRGVDYSDTMLDQFRQDHPGITLKRGDAATYNDGRTYDLIFTNGVVCYLPEEQFRSSLQNAQKMLAPDGVIFHGTVANVRLQTPFILGHPPYVPRTIGSWLRGLKPLVAAKVLRRTSMHWWDARRLERVCAEEGFEARFYGSVFYPYRFHVVLTRR